MVDDLSLYLYDGCPFCERVRGAARDLGIELEERNIHRDPEHMRALLHARGRRTVPVLRIHDPDGPDEWMGESADIVRYLYDRFGDDDAKPPRSFGGWLTMLMWGLWLGGAVASEPLRSALWVSACAVAGGRSVRLAYRTGAWFHWAIGAVFLFGAASIGLSALEIVDLPWWYAAFAVAAAALAGVLWRRPRAV